MISEAFLTALLLTRSLDSAEQAVTQAIDRSDSSLESIFHGTILESLKNVGVASTCELTAASQILPPALFRLLIIPFRDARCFVLLFLVGLSRKKCAEALDLRESEVDQAALKAAILLSCGEIELREDREASTIPCVQ